MHLNNPQRSHQSLETPVLKNETLPLPRTSHVLMDFCESQQSQNWSPSSISVGTREALLKLTTMRPKDILSNQYSQRIPTKGHKRNTH